MCAMIALGCSGEIKARHSFVSPHVAAYQNPGKTALLNSHTDDPSVLYESYYGVHGPDEKIVTKAMGLEYFEIAPGI